MANPATQLSTSEQDTEPRLLTATELAIALVQLQECQENSDTEEAHGKADRVLVSVLRTIGYDQLVNEYKKVAKWYA